MQTTSFRACEPCRALKVRCKPADGDASAGPDAPPSSTPTPMPPVTQRPPCRRCRDTGTECVYTEPRRTKRKRTDVRVRELEREVHMLSELLTLRHRARDEGLPEPAAEKSAAAGSPFASIRSSSALARSDTPPVFLPGLPPGALVQRTTPRARQPEQPAGPSPSPSPEQAADRALTLDPPPAVVRSVDLPPLPKTADPVAAGLLSMDKAVRMFRWYVTAMAPQRPFVVFPAVTRPAAEGRTRDVEDAVARVAAEVREQTPVLFLAIVTAALATGGDLAAEADARRRHDPGPDNDVLAGVLTALLMRVYADRIVYEGEKSLELVQALLVSSNWNFYTEVPSSNGSAAGSGSGTQGDPRTGNFDRLRFYQHLHMAATMAVELESSHRECHPRAGPPSNPLVFERTLLSCYTCCSSLTLGFHRQNLLPFTPLMAEYLALLETSPHAAPTDYVLVAWAHLQRIVDTTADVLGLRTKIGSASGSRETGARNKGIPDLADPSIQLNLQNVTRQLEQWRQDYGPCMTNSLVMQYHTLMGLLHEPCFYTEFDASDLLPPFRVSVPSAAPSASAAAVRLTPAHLASRQMCLTTARALIGIFLSSPTDELRASPCIVYARVGYAVVVLIKLQISAALPGGAMHGLLLDTATDSSATQVYQYIRALITRLAEITALRCRIANVWLSIVRTMHTWYETYFLPALKGGVEPDRADNAGNRAGEPIPSIGPVLEPLRHFMLPGLKQSQPASPPAVHSSAQAQTQSHVPFANQAYASFAAFATGLDTSDDSMMASIAPAMDDYLSGTFADDEFSRWITDPSLEEGGIQDSFQGDFHVDFQGELFECPGMQLPC